MLPQRYKYRALDVTRNSMRTIRLRSASVESEPVVCEIDVTVLNDGDERSGPGVSYEALSYTWGDTATPHDIVVNGRMLAITDNLFRILLHLRHRHRDRVLWIDAICIDQDNPAERMHQVDLMKRIYGQAQTVLIWLGPETFETRIVMRYLLEVDRRVLASGARLDTPDAWTREFQGTGPMVRHMLPLLFESPWFRRIWVIQEAASAKAALVMYGHDAVPARTFAMLSTLPSADIPGSVRAALEVMPGPLKRTSWWKESRDLLTLLCKFSEYEATDPRDKVYALLGISESRRDQPVKIKPDYLLFESRLRMQVNTLIAAYLFPDADAMPDAEEIFEDVRDYTSGLPNSISDLAGHVFLWAIRYRRKRLAKALIHYGRGLDVNSLPGRGSPLWELAHQTDEGNEEVIKMLLARPEIDVNLPFDGCTPLNVAMTQSNACMIAALVTRADIDIWHVGLDGQYPLETAMLYCNSDSSAECRAAEAFIMAHRTWENEVVMELVKDAFPEALETIRKCRRKTYSRLLWEAVNTMGEEPGARDDKRGGLEVIEHCLGEGAYTDYRGEEAMGYFNHTPLGRAASLGRLAAVKLMLEHKADPNSGESVTGTGYIAPLWAAASAGHYEVVSLLLDAGADPGWKADGMSARDAALEGGHDRVASLLQEKHVEYVADEEAEDEEEVAEEGAEEGAKEGAEAGANEEGQYKEEEYEEGEYEKEEDEEKVNEEKVPEEEVDKKVDKECEHKEDEHEKDEDEEDKQREDKQKEDKHEKDEHEKDEHENDKHEKDKHKEDGHKKDVHKQKE